MALHIADLGAEDARELTDRIKVAVEGSWLLIKQAYETRAWSALGYASWDDYCTREFGSSRLRLPREERQEVVASLRESGLSVRAIASATGISTGSVENDLRGVQICTPSEEVTGTDGKVYPTSLATDVNPRSRAGVAARIGKAKEMAAQGYTSRQIAPEIGVAAESFAGWRLRHGIEVPADAAVGRPRHHESNRIVAEMVTTLEAVVMGLDVIDVDALDPERKDDWVASLASSTRSLNRFIKQTKETTL